MSQQFTRDPANKREDAAHTSGDEGKFILTVRDDALAGQSSTDGDYQPFLTDSTGRVWSRATIDAELPAGTQNIGDVDVASIAAGDNNIGNVDIVSMPVATTASHANVADSATSVQLLASNSARRSASVYNDSSAELYLKYGTAASATSFKVIIAAAGYFEFPQPIYTGVVHGAWASAPGGAARVTEEA